MYFFLHLVSAMYPTPPLSHPMYIVKLKKDKHLQFMNYFLDG